MASDEEKKQNDVVEVELPAPAGWIKKLIPKKGSSASKKNSIVFVSPNGEEIKSKRQLQQYLKSHPGGPDLLEFYWGSDDTPRRSARLGGKSKAEEESGSKSSRKKQKKSSTEKGAEEKNGEDESADDKDAATDEIKKTGEVSENAGDGEVVPEEDLPQQPDFEDVDKETQSKDIVGEILAVENPYDDPNENPNAKVEETNGATNNSVAITEESKDASTEVASANAEESKRAHDAEKETPAAKVDSAETVLVDQDSTKGFDATTKSVLKSEESKNASTEVAGANAGESERTHDTPKESPSTKVDAAETILVDQDNSKEKQTTENSIENDSTLAGK